MKKPVPYTWLFGGAVCAGIIFCLVAWMRPDPSAVASPVVAVIAPAAPVPDPPPAVKLPTFAELIGDTGFMALKPKSDRVVTASALIDPPIPAPLATVAAAEATAPPSPSSCEITVRRLAGATKAPVRESIFDDIEAKYELIRVNANTRFLAIRGACVPKGHPTRR